MNIEITQKQKKFIDADADEVLFGGRAGGGKSYAQIIDALIYALKYPGSKQLILRRTFPELDRSLIRTALALYPQSIYRYTATNHIGRFSNGSVLEFGYCDSENDVYKYQSAEYDVIRFDELTHFTKQMYVYLISRLRGVNGYPKQVKSSTNPGGVGHSWVKERFIDIGRADEKTHSRRRQPNIHSVVGDGQSVFDEKRRRLCQKAGKPVGKRQKGSALRRLGHSGGAVLRRVEQANSHGKAL